jgi:HlyD family secretion protein
VPLRLKNFKEHTGASAMPPPLADGMDRAITPIPAWRRYGPYAVLAALAVGILCWALLRTGGNTYRVPMDRVTFGKVTRGVFEDFIAVRGTAAPFTTHYLTADQGGTVKQVLSEDGAIVKAGLPLIILANPALELQVATREADSASQLNALQNTKLQLEEGRFKYQRDLLEIEHQIQKLAGDLARDKILLDGNAIAPSMYRQEEEEYAYQVKLKEAIVASRDTEQKIREQELTQLRETITRLAQSIATARASLEALTIRAPTDGRLTALNAEVGQSKAQGAVLGQVDSLDRFKLTAQVDEFYLGRVAPGQVALFTLDGHDYRATVAKIYPQITNGTFRIDLTFEDPSPGGIRAGQAVDIRLELGGAATALLLPYGPFFQDTGGNWVFTVAPNGRYATRRAVRFGRRNPQYLEVIQGLAPGETVVLSAYEGFQKMDRIEFDPSGKP